MLHSVISSVTVLCNIIKYMERTLKDWALIKHPPSLALKVIKNTKPQKQGNMSPSFEMVVGLRQGNELSTLLLNMYMEKVTRNVKTNPEGTIFNLTRQCSLYTDDVAVLGHTVKHAAWTEENKTHVALQTGWTIHISKTKYIINEQKYENVLV